MTTRPMVQWKNRGGMVRRGASIWHAHWTNSLDADQFHRWYARHIHRYAAFWQGNVIDNRAAVEKRFWADAERYCLENIYGFGLEDYRS